MAGQSLPSGIVTFFFTDVEGSTRLWDRHGPAMARAIARHDVLLSRAIEAHGGVIFKTVGDAFCAAFQRADDALMAAVEVQRALAAEAWGEVGTLRARVALHVGVAEERDRDYFGPNVNRVARLLAAGHGGQVLLSAAMVNALAGGLPDTLALRDLGERRLRDLAAPERISQLVIPGLPDAFPPLNALDARPNNLPVQPTALLGRDEELTEVKAQLREPGTRVLTLTGPGGTGKTRLALQTAADVIDDFAHGVWFVDLSATTDPALVSGTIAQALGIREEGGTPLDRQLTEYLREKELLLLLDNFEHLLPAATLVSTLLAGAPNLKTLATSRAPLRLAGEREYPVPPLGVPDLRRLPAPTRLESFPAVELFVERATAVRPSFALTEENAAAVARIVAELDGLPLAIELAAARIRMLPPQAILSRLERRLALLTGGARDLSRRQQTVRDTIAWSVDLLTTEQQALFARLSVFAGGCTLEAAEALCTSDHSLDVFDGLGVLVEHSLMRQDELMGEPRFRMLATIREYGQDLLERRGEAEALSAAHAAFYAAFAEETLAEEDDAAWLRRLESEHDNVRSALAWLHRGGTPEEELRLAGALWGFWRVRGHLTEGRTRLEAALSRGDGAAGDVRARAVSGAGVLAEAQGDYESAAAHFEEALAWHRQSGDRVGMASALSNLGLVRAGQERTAEAASLHEQSLALARETDDVVGVVVSLNNLGTLACMSGEHRRAADYYDEALTLSRQTGAASYTAMSLCNLAGATRSAGDLERAATLYPMALRLCKELDFTDGIADCLAGLACIAAAREDFVLAARLLGAAEALSQASGQRLMPWDHADYELAVERTRRSLGGATFTAQSAEGRGMSLDSLVAGTASAAA